MDPEVRLTRSFGAHAWVRHVSGDCVGVAIGVAHDSGVLLRAGDMAGLVAACDDGQAFVDLAARLNGVFALVQLRPGSVLGAVDRVRSFPLFVADTNEGNILTDDPVELAGRVPVGRMSRVASAQILRCGYSLGEDTLFPAVKQMRAGQRTAIDSMGPKHAFYYRHLRGVPADRSIGEWCDLLDDVSAHVFARLAEALEGRQCVIPLSAGYDSRYVLAGLLSVGYDHVVCYTYGKLGSHEVATASAVADAVGVPWHRVDYDTTTWSRFLRSEDARRFRVASTNASALPHVQDFEAVRSLVMSGVIRDDAFVVPGFCGDLLGGSYVPEGYEQALRTGRVDDLGQYVYSRHMVLDNGLTHAAESELRVSVLRSASELGVPDSVDDLVSLNEAWFTEHKVARFVINALRAYEHHGLSWLLPLWDNELTEAWYSVPNSLRVESRLWNRYLLERVFPRHGIVFRKPEPLRASPVLRGAEHVVGKRAFEAVRARYARIKMRRRPPDPNGFLSLSAQMRVQMLSLGLRVSATPDVNQALVDDQVIPQPEAA